MRECSRRTIPQRARAAARECSAGWTFRCWRKRTRKTGGRRVIVGELLDFGRDLERAEKSRPPDWEARAQALDIRQSWIVEAPAGSGKTGLLIQRYLKLLADESVEQPEHVLAITFTVKATAEMRERVVAQLEIAARGDALKGDADFERETRRLALAVLQRDALLGWGLLEHPRRLKIRT